MSIAELIDELTTLAQSVGTSAPVYVETTYGDITVGSVERSGVPIGARLILGRRTEHYRTMGDASHDGAGPCARCAAGYPASEHFHETPQDD